MNNWVDTVRKFYLDKLISSGFRLNNQSLYGEDLKNLPDVVLDTLNKYMGGLDMDPLEIYKLKVHQEDTYGLIVTWGSGDAWIIVLDSKQLIGVAYVASEDEPSNIQWFDSFSAMGRIV